MLSFLKKQGENGDGKGNMTWLILIGAAVGIALLMLGGQSERREADETEKVYSPTEDELILYQSYLEERIRVLCESVDGISDVTAVVTLSGGFEEIYATELTEKGETYVIVGSGSSAKALPLSRAAPEIAGVGIVCRGGNNAEKRQELISLLGASLHISSNRIYITEAKS